ncbi:amino acid ABC transporter permease [Microvirga terricola]|uniref:Amino acid ABC transporter permease n=1 Tax=Microvirga terricola TaxID=2719797 RepID=A0ABX0V7X0_9HYPH|nr:amino acid ABC transporter permease [Microvirga terricola]NIX75947.1 amino acid ABC transporter permease [Microvirga terricola]
MDFGLMARIFPFFLEAALVTIELSLLSLALGLTVAAVITMFRLSRLRTLRAIGTLYVSLMRGTPCLIQLFILYFGGPQIGINLSPFAAGAIGLGMNIGAYMAEAMRGAILAVDRGQTEAARVLGFSRFETMRIVVLPQAAKLMIRPLGVNAVALVKGTALVSTISVVDLTYTAQRFIGSTYKPFEIFAVAAILYMAMIYALSKVVDFLDRRYAAA